MPATAPDNPVLRLLAQRSSEPRLAGPAPSVSEFDAMVTAALRAPDHARLRPWRFLCVRGARRADLGSLFREALLARNPQADAAAQDKALNAPLRAPLVVVVVARIVAHPKVPRLEQLLSAGCAAYGLLLAAGALGYAGIWRTGDAAYDRGLLERMGLAGDEEVVGFLYLGTREGEPRPVPPLAPGDFVTEW